MEGPAPAARGDRLRRTILPIVVIAVGSALIASIVVFTAPGFLPSPNTPPYGLAISVTPAHPDNATTVTFTATVYDREDSASALQVRWAWQASGSWDTGWATAKTVPHRFPVPGNYSIGMEAMDTGGLTASTTTNLSVALAHRPPPPALRIGTVLSISGALGAFGQGQQNGVDMAVGEINAAGGVQGQPVQVFHMDDQTNPATAANAANTLITTDHVDAIIGATGSGMCSAIVPYAQGNAVVEVSPSCTNPLFSNLTLTGGWFFRTVPSDALQGVVGAHFAYANRSWRNVSIIAIDNAYGQDTASTFAAEFTSLGGRIFIKEIVPQAQPSYSSYLQTVFSAGTPDAIYFIGYSPDGVQLLKDWWANRASWPTQWLFSEGVYDPYFINSLVTAGVNVSAFEGTSPALYAGWTPPAYGPWAARYANLYGPQPTLFAANAYDAAYLVALAAEAAGNVSGPAIRAHIAAVAGPPGTVIGPGGWSSALTAIGAHQDINYEGASGDVNLNAAGDVPTSYIIWAVNASNQLYTLLFFPESLVLSFIPGGFPQILSGGPVAASWVSEPRP